MNDVIDLRGKDFLQRTTIEKLIRFITKKINMTVIVYWYLLNEYLISFILFTSITRLLLVEALFRSKFLMSSFHLIYIFLGPMNPKMWFLEISRCLCMCVCDYVGNIQGFILPKLIKIDTENFIHSTKTK